MPFLSALLAIAASLSTARAIMGNPVPYQRLDANDTALLIVDLQVGLTRLAGDWEAVKYKEAMFAHASLGELFNLPVIMTTSYESGPNGPLPKEFLEMYPDAPLIARPGQINSWDSPEFRDAIRATNRSQLVIAGITTDVCVAYLALSLREEGYYVVVNEDASGTFNERVANLAIDRMTGAGVQVMNLWSILGELFRDWRNPSPNATQFVTYVDRYVPEVSWLVRSHAAALEGGEAVGGEMETIAVGSAEECRDVI